MKWNKMDIRDHFEFRIKVIDPDYDMIVCMPNGTYLKKNRKDSLMTKDFTIFAERFSLDEKTGLKINIIPMILDEAIIYVKNFNKIRKERGWKPIVFDVLE